MFKVPAAKGILQNASQVNTNFSNGLLLQTPCLTTEKLKHLLSHYLLSERSKEHLQATVVFPSTFKIYITGFKKSKYILKSCFLKLKENVQVQVNYLFFLTAYYINHTSTLFSWKQNKDETSTKAWEPNNPLPTIPCKNTSMTLSTYKTWQT